MECSDERVRVYAMLGLPSKDTKIVDEIYPDYTLSVMDVNYNFASACVKAGRMSDLLISVMHPVSRQELPTNMPSWVPTWDLSFTKRFPLAARLMEECNIRHVLDINNRSLTA
jgi:hypothetical protein